MDPAGPSVQGQASQVGPLCPDGANACQGPLGPHATSWSHALQPIPSTATAGRILAGAVTPVIFLHGMPPYAHGCCGCAGPEQGACAHGGCG